MSKLVKTPPPDPSQKTNQDINHGDVEEVIAEGVIKPNANNNNNNNVEGKPPPRQF